MLPTKQDHMFFCKQQNVEQTTMVHFFHLIITIYSANATYPSELKCNGEKGGL